MSALPEIGRDLDADTGALQWTLNGYLVTLSALILLGGSLGDRLGRRRVFNIGVVWFTVASVVCVFAPSVELLVVARVLQGVGGALLTPGSLAIIEATFRPEDRARRNRCVVGAGRRRGRDRTTARWLPGRRRLLAGDLLYQCAVWHLRGRDGQPPRPRDPRSHCRGQTRLPRRRPRRRRAGLGHLCADRASEGAGTTTILLSGAAGVLGLGGFIVTERRSANPMMPLSIFASRQFAAANLVTFIVYAALGGVFFLLVAFLQISLGYSAIAAGAASLPVTALMLLLSPRAGALAQRIGPRLPLTLGPLLIAAGMLLMTQIDRGDSYTTSVFPAVFVFGLGLALVVAPVTATVLAAADERHSGVASGVNNAVARVAGLIAVAALPLVAGLSGPDFFDPAAMAEGFGIAMVATAALAASGALLAWFTIDAQVLETAPVTPDEPRIRARSDRHCAVAGTPLGSRHPSPEVHQPRAS